MAENRGKKGSDEIAIASILAGVSRKEAAEAAGIYEATLYRCLRDDEFASKLRRKREEIFEEAVEEIKCAHKIAMETLVDIMMNGEKEAARVAAARIILDKAIAAAKINNLEGRVSKLEIAVKDNMELE